MPFLTSELQFGSNPAAPSLQNMLTTRPSRQRFLDRLQPVVDRARAGGDLCAILLLTIDRFPFLAEALGTEVERLILKIDQRLRVLLPESTEVVGLAAHEMGIIIENQIDVDELPALGEHLLAALRRPFDLGGRRISVGARLGIAASTRGDSAAELLRNADLALYEAAQREERVVLFDPGLRLESRKRFELECDLHGAIERLQLQLSFQPIVSLESARTVGLETALRWEHSHKGTLLAEQVEDVACAAGLQSVVHHWLLHQACLQLAAWRKEYPTAKELQICVPAGADQLLSARFVPEVEELLRDSGLLPTDLKLIVTDGARIERSTTAMQTVSGLQDLGVGFHLGRFGFRSGGLGYLRQIWNEAVKIDRSLVSTMVHDPVQAEIVRSLVLLGRELGARVVAEGVEDAAQLRMLSRMGCHCVQGPLFAAPLEAPRVPQTLLGRFDPPRLTGWIEKVIRDYAVLADQRAMSTLRCAG